jgi:hypothetical protein
MRWLSDLFCCRWPVPAPATPRHGHRYRPRLDLLDGREAPSSGFSDFTTSPLPSVAEVGQLITLYISVEEPAGDNTTGSVTAYVDWGDGSAIEEDTAAFRKRNGPSDEYNNSTDVASHVYGPQELGMPFSVSVSLYDGTNWYGPVTVGSITVVAAPGVPAAAHVSPTGDTTADFLVFPQKSSFNSASGTTKQTVLLLNASGQTIDGPFFVALAGLKHSVKLSNEIGVSKVTAPGDPFLYVPGDQVAPWQGVSLTLDFHSSTGSRVSPTSYHTLVFSGTIVS